MAATPDRPMKDEHETDVIGTLMSLVVAFTLAMAFRGFVLEGFIIPTGSMGPTLMGAHARLASPVTGYEYAADTTPIPAFAGNRRQVPFVDPMVSSRLPIGADQPEALAAQTRNGDRVLVLKPLYAFSEPQRWDVVVFKNPTDPAGDFQTYIKRMVGLPNESFLLVDGDVFTGPADARTQDLRIQRKPEVVQRAVWQPIYRSDFEPMIAVQQLESAMRNPWSGAPWRPGAGTPGWSLAPAREWTHPGGGTASLEWDAGAFPLDDWNAYNVLWMMAREASPHPPSCFAISDLRLRATVRCAQLAQFSTTFRIAARSNVMEFAIRGTGEVTMTRSSASGERLGDAHAAFAPRADGVLSFECWHVDQQLWAFIDGRCVAQLPYEYGSLDDRVLSSCVGRTVEQYARQPWNEQAPTPAKLSWNFESAAPFTVTSVGVDRDLYYRPVNYDHLNQPVVNCPVDGTGRPQFLEGPGFACDYEHPARLGGRDYVMLGDNSSHSRDARRWGRAHELALRTFGDSQPGVVPRDMIVGKAWAVYFPAPLGLWQGLLDFGRVRFIR